MKTYYLQMSGIINITHAAESSEYKRMQCLCRKLKQFIHALQLINTHEWGRGTAEIQTASGVYMMQNSIPHKDLLQTNREIAGHLQFITQLAGNVGYLKQLEGILHYHQQNVSKLLKSLETEQDKQ